MLFGTRTLYIDAVCDALQECPCELNQTLDFVTKYQRCQSQNGKVVPDPPISLWGIQLLLSVVLWSLHYTQICLSLLSCLPCSHLDFYNMLRTICILSPSSLWVLSTPFFVTSWGPKEFHLFLLIPWARCSLWHIEGVSESVYWIELLNAVLWSSLLICIVFVSPGGSLIKWLLNITFF